MLATSLQLLHGREADGLLIALDKLEISSLSSGDYETAVIVAVVVALTTLFFGGSHDHPASMPDKYDEPTYGQGVANLKGTMGATPAGQPYTTYTENPDLRTLLGGRTEIEAVEETMNTYSSPNSAPAWLQGEYTNLQGMFGSSAAGSGTLAIGINGSGKDANNQQIVGVPGVNGQVYQYNQLDAAATEFQLNYVNAVMNGQVARFAYADPTGAPAPANADYPLSYAQQDFYA